MFFHPRIITRFQHIIFYVLKSYKRQHAEKILPLKAVRFRTVFAHTHTSGGVKPDQKTQQISK